MPKIIILNKLSSAITTISLILSTMFASTKHPISMIIYLMCFTITTSMKSYLIHNNAWYSYTILLIMIGGMMIIFIYMTSTMPNQKIKTPITTAFTLITLTFMMTKQTPSSSTQNLFTNPILEFLTNTSTILLTTYLLISLIIINKITSHFEGPMQTST